MDTPIVRCYGFVYNPRSGDGGRRSIVLAAMLRLKDEGHETREYAATGDPSAAALAAARDGCDVLVACGGDGTVNGVAQVAQSQDRILGVLPLGTLNHFARDLGLRGLAMAEQTLSGDFIRAVDAGFVNGHLFVNNSGIGIYPMLVLERERVRRSGVPRWPAFAVACIRILLNLPFRHLRLEADGRHFAQSMPFLFVGNNTYTVEGMAMGHRHSLEDGLLSVCAARHVKPWGLIRLAIRAFAGTVRDDRDFTAFEARRLTVRRRRKGNTHVSLDGEVRRMKMPLEYSILPAAIRVLAPKPK